jgi:hypothetical protein
MAQTDPAELVDLVHQVELSDPNASRWPRTKCHDDKALAVISVCSPLTSLVISTRSVDSVRSSAP